ncbi:MAG: hypothetical protein RSB55_07230 [Oscillospiraceae bacterium]
MNSQQDDLQSEEDSAPRKGKKGTSHQKKRPRPGKGHSVVLYLAILFAAAFVLLLMSYFMQQRTNDAAISGLQQSISSMQSMENMIDDNSKLQERVAALDEKNDALMAEKSKLELELVQTKAELAAARRLLDEVSVAP